MKQRTKGAFLLLLPSYTQDCFQGYAERAADTVRKDESEGFQRFVWNSVVRLEFLIKEALITLMSSLVASQLESLL